MQLKWFENKSYHTVLKKIYITAKLQTSKLSLFINEQTVILNRNK